MPFFDTTDCLNMDQNADHLRRLGGASAADWWSGRRIDKLTASGLDRLADAELQHGHVARAEHLARLAHEMRVAP